MLGKLIAQELRATRRVYLPFYLAILVLTAINALLVALVWNAPDNGTGIPVLPAGVLMTLYVLALFAVWIVALMYTIVRFKKNLLSDEGYLMFTLPVRPSQLIWSKAIVSLIWVLLTAAVCVLSLVVLFAPTLTSSAAQEMWAYLGLKLSQLWEAFRVHAVLIGAEVILLVIAAILAFCMSVYACLSVGQLFQRHRLAWAFGAYIGFEIILQVILLPAMNALANHPVVIASMDYTIDGVLQTGQMELVLLFLIAVQAVITAIFFVITDLILTRRLNLQ